MGCVQASAADAAAGPGAAVSAEQASEWLGKYSKMESLVEALASGDTVLVKGSWLVEHARSDRALPRRQDLPQEAVWDPKELGPLLLKITDHNWHEWEIIPMALSYCWATKEHPDPTGEQTRRVACAVRPYISGALPCRDIAIFIDWCSLYQEPRSEEETLVFKRGLRDVNLWYAHREVISLLLTVVPEGVRAYKERGWPSFEFAIAGLAKMDSKVLDLGVALPAPDESFSSLRDVYHKLVIPSKTGRPPPCTPEAFTAKLDLLHFTNGADRGFVEGKYRNTFQEVMSSLEELNFPRLDWGVEDIKEIAAALPWCKSVDLLDITGSMIGPEGAKHIAQALPRCPPLRVLDLSSCGVGQEGLVHVLAVLPQTNVRCVFLKDNGLDDAAAESLADFVGGKRAPALHELSLRDNSVTDAGAARLVAELCEGSCEVRTLRLNENEGVTDASVEALSAALRQSPRLEVLDLRDTTLTAVGRERLRSAATERSGSVVQVML